MNIAVTDLEREFDKLFVGAEGQLFELEDVKDALSHNLRMLYSSNVVALTSLASEVDYWIRFQMPGTYKFVHQNNRYYITKDTVHLTPEITSGPQLRREGNCRQCSRMNDLGVGKCWFCECSNPV